MNLFHKLFPMKGRLLLVADGAGWIHDQIAQNLVCHLPLDLRPRLTVRGWQEARECILHFIDRPWVWFDGALDGVHPSNHLIGLWWHGRLDSPQPEIQTALNRLRKLHTRFLFMQAACTESAETLRRVGIPPEKIVLLPQGVDLTRFHPASSDFDRQRLRRRLNIPADSIAIGSFQKDGVGWKEGDQPKWIKGPDLLAEVMGRLKKRYPVHAVIPGPSRGYLKKRLTQLGVPFSAPGFVPAHADFPVYYHALDFYLSASRDEGGPAGILESMASGIPVVSTRTGMATDLIQDGTSGLLCDVEDVEGLTQKAGRLIENEALRRSMAQAALEMIQPYDWPTVSKRYARELYARIR